MKMYFFYGVMGASKTAIALMKKYSFEEHGKKVVLVKPAIDNRDGVNIVKSRVGLQSKAIFLERGETFFEKVPEIEKYNVIITDESQFFSENQIEELRLLADNHYIVLCYGLKNDFKGHLFEGSKRLLELADCIREIPSPCNCGRKATMILKMVDGKAVRTGEQIDIGGNEKYLSVCHYCYNNAFFGKINER